MKPTISMLRFMDRQRDPNQGLTHWEISDAELIQRIQDNWDNRRPGYREGVVLVPISSEGIKAGIRILQPGDPLTGSYNPRREGETPRKTLRYMTPGSIADAKITPVSTDVVLYHQDVLAEDDTFIDEEWGIVTVLGKLCGADQEEPMDPTTLMANHFHDDGGSQTGMTPEEFEKALRASYWHWRDKAILG